MGITIKDFAEKTLGIDYKTLKKRKISIKFIIADGKVVFDPELFVKFEKSFGEGSLYHKDIADANNIDRGRVRGGAFATISADEVAITGHSMDFGGIKGYEDNVKNFFENYFNAKICI